jgi:hypothetical protein
MATVVNLKNPVDVRMAGMRALTAALGYDGAQAFLSQSFGGKGDYTKDKYELPEPSFEELTAELRKVDAEMRASGRYDKK